MKILYPHPVSQSSFTARLRKALTAPPPSLPRPLHPAQAAAPVQARGAARAWAVSTAWPPPPQCDTPAVTPMVMVVVVMVVMVVVVVVVVVVVAVLVARGVMLQAPPDHHRGYQPASPPLRLVGGRGRGRRETERVEGQVQHREHARGAGASVPPTNCDKAGPHPPHQPQLQHSGGTWPEDGPAEESEAGLVRQLRVAPLGRRTARGDEVAVVVAVVMIDLCAHALSAAHPALVTSQRCSAFSGGHTTPLPKHGTSTAAAPWECRPRFPPTSQQPRAGWTRGFGPRQARLPLAEMYQQKPKA